MPLPDSTVDFDPYHKWLGIPESEQPPNHYRLLGIELFEEDAEVIQAAADRQMSHVKAFATGRYGAQSQLLLNELSKARVNLLNAKLKSVYDQQLVKEHSKKIKDAEVAERTAAKSSEAELPSESASLVLRDQPTLRRNGRKKTTPPVGLLTKTLLALGIIACSVIAYRLATSGRSDTTLAQEGSSQQVQNDEDDTPAESPTESDQTLSEDSDNLVAAPDDSNPIDGDGDHTLGSLLEEDSEAAKALFGGLDSEDEIADPKEPSAENPVVEPSPSTEVSPFASLPTVVSLADFVNEGKPVGQFAAPIELLPNLDVAVLLPKYLERGNNRVTIEKVPRSETELWWKVFEESRFGVDSLLGDDDFGIGNDPKPVAIVRATPEGIGLVCYGGGANTGKLSRLQNCMLSFTSGKYSHVIQMRNPIVDASPIVVDDWSDPRQVPVDLDTIPDCPPADEMLMRVNPGSGLPKTIEADGLEDRLPRGEQLWLRFETNENAGVRVSYEEQDSQLLVNLSLGFYLPTLGGSFRLLSPEGIDGAKSDVLENRARATQNLAIAKRKSNRKWRSTLNARIAASHEDETTRIPALKELSEQLKTTCDVGFELYLPVGSERVVIYRRAMPEAN